MKSIHYYNNPNVVDGYIDWHEKNQGSNAAIFNVMISALLRKKLPLMNGVLVDLASGPGTSIYRMLPLGFTKLYAIDGAANMLSKVIRFAREYNLDIETRLADFDYKPELFTETNFADVVLLCSGAMYCADLEYFFSQARKMLKPKGVFATNILIRTDSNEKAHSFLDEDGIPTHLFSEKEVRYLVEKYSFSIGDILSDDLECEITPTEIPFTDIQYLFVKK